MVKACSRPRTSCLAQVGGESRSGKKIPRRKACRFDSGLGHHQVIQRHPIKAGNPSDSSDLGLSLVRCRPGASIAIGPHVGAMSGALGNLRCRKAGNAPMLTDAAIRKAKPIDKPHACSMAVAYIWKSPRLVASCGGSSTGSAARTSVSRWVRTLILASPMHANDVTMHASCWQQVSIPASSAKPRRWRGPRLRQLQRTRFRKWHATGRTDRTSPKSRSSRTSGYWKSSCSPRSAHCPLAPSRRAFCWMHCAKYRKQRAAGHGEPREDQGRAWLSSAKVLTSL